MENVPHILQLQGVYKRVSITELSTCRLNFPPAVGSPFMKNVVFVVFTTTKRNQALLSHVYGKIWPRSNQFWLWFLEPFRYNNSIQWDIFIEDTWTGTQTTETQTFFCAHEEIEYFNDNSNCDYVDVISSIETLWKATFYALKTFYVIMIWNYDMISFWRHI